MITAEIYQTRSKTKKFVPVLFVDSDKHFIPEPLRVHTHYVLDLEKNYTRLYRFLTGQAGVVQRDLGPLKKLARKEGMPLAFNEGERSRGDLHTIPDASIPSKAKPRFQTAALAALSIIVVAIPALLLMRSRKPTPHE